MAKKRDPFTKKTDEVKTGNKRNQNGKFLKGGKGGPGRTPGVKVRVERAAGFMDKKGWDELEYHALQRANPKVAVSALQTLAAYGYGKPIEMIEFTGEGEARTIAEFLSNKKVKGKEKPNS